jgi:glycosyltransferase involved in cell wall biosynthesis
MISNYLRQFNKKITLTTSPIVDLNIIKKNRNAIFTIGWIGDFGGGHKESLIDLVFPAIKNLSFDIKFILIGVSDIENKLFIENYFSENPNIEIEIPQEIDWNNEKEIQNRIVTLDLGIATLTNDLIQLSKSGIKVKQYLNNGIPVLCNNRPENNTVLVDGKNGFFCDNANEFENKIYEFYKMDDENYLEFSKKARNSITNFNHIKFFKGFEKIKNLE